MNLTEIQAAIAGGRRTSWKRDSGNGLVTTGSDTWESLVEWMGWKLGQEGREGETVSFRVCLLDPDTNRIDINVSLASGEVTISEP